MISIFGVWPFGKRCKDTFCVLWRVTPPHVDVGQMDILKESHSILPLSNQNVFRSLTDVPFTFLNDPSLCYIMSLHNILFEQETRHIKKLKVQFYWDRLKLRTHSEFVCEPETWMCQLLRPKSPSNMETSSSLTPADFKPHKSQDFKVYLDI